MNISIPLGWWLAPALITVAAFVWAWWADSDNRGATNGYAAIGQAMGSFMVLALATIVSLLAWLVYFIVRTFA